MPNWWPDVSVFCANLYDFSNFLDYPSRILDGFIWRLQKNLQLVIVKLDDCFKFPFHVFLPFFPLRTQKTSCSWAGRMQEYEYTKGLTPTDTFAEVWRPMQRAEIQDEPRVTHIVTDWRSDWRKERVLLPTLLSLTTGAQDHRSLQVNEWSDPTKPTCAPITTNQGSKFRWNFGIFFVFGSYREVEFR